MIKSSELSKVEKLVKREDSSTSEVIQLLASPNTLIKKTTCNYLVDKFTSNSDLPLLTANLLLKDCNDPNPSVRSTSLMAISSLTSMPEASIKVLDKCMSDASSQVRRAAAFACTQFYKVNDEAFTESNLIDRLYEGIRDPDPIVMTNCLIALEFILANEGGVVINRNIAQHLYGRLTSYSDCDLAYILNFLLNYTPKCDEEILYYLNQLDFCLNLCVPSILISSTKLFIHLTKSMKNLIPDMLEIIKNPICKILSQSASEGAYLLLEFIENLKVDLTSVLGNQYKYFLLRVKDPTYMKCKKLKFLPLIANKNNVTDIISEVKHFTADYQSFQAAFYCLAKLGTLSQDSIGQVFIVLTPLLNSSNEALVIPALKCLISVIIDSVENKLVTKEELGSLITGSLINNLIFVITEATFQENNVQLLLYTLMIFVPFLKDIQDCFEFFLKKYQMYNDETKCLLIKTAGVAFLSWPASMQPMLSTLISKALDSPESAPAQQAAFVYVALKSDVKKASNILSIGPFEPRSLTDSGY